MKILTISAHPDDIEPQMGGTLLKYAKNGHKVLMVNAIIPCENNRGEIIPGAKEIRAKEAHIAAGIIGAELEILDLSPYELKFNRHLVQKIDKIVKKFKPDAVYTCWNYDSHQDHQAIAQATFAATRKNIENLYMFEPVIPGGLVPHSFDANVYVDISEEIKEKIKSIKAYKSQTKIYKDWLPAIEARSKFRGFQINADYAEAFQVVREIKSIK